MFIELTEVSDKGPEGTDNGLGRKFAINADHILTVAPEDPTGDARSLLRTTWGQKYVREEYEIVRELLGFLRGKAWSH